jgi:3',5'-cyclic AMP phosphodiesterase CpdA
MARVRSMGWAATREAVTTRPADRGTRRDDRPRLLAVSDLHVGYPENDAIAERLAPVTESDWLIVAGDVGEQAADVERVLAALSQRFARVIWVPGNHELWTHRRDPLRLRGQDRYLHLVAACRRLGVVTPEDPFPVWPGEDGPVVIVPLFVLYDYSFRPEGAATATAGLERARAAGIVSSDERMLHPDPYPSREAWCADRLAISERRLASELPAGVPTVLVNHFPLVREPTRVMRYPVFAQWCGTERTAAWPARYGAEAVVYGHLHIPRTTWHDGVRHEEVSLGYPREWKRRPVAPVIPRQILPSLAADPPPGPPGSR